MNKIVYLKKKTRLDWAQTDHEKQGEPLVLQPYHKYHALRIICFFAKSK
jgi:hypothetical protein